MFVWAGSELLGVGGRGLSLYVTGSNDSFLISTLSDKRLIETPIEHFLSFPTVVLLIQNVLTMLKRVRVGTK